MNEFTVTDGEGSTHWVQTCMNCKALVETDNIIRHFDWCARVTAMTSPSAGETR